MHQSLARFLSEQHYFKQARSERRFSQLMLCGSSRLSEESEQGYETLHHFDELKKAFSEGEDNILANSKHFPFLTSIILVLSRMSLNQLFSTQLLISDIFVMALVASGNELYSRVS